MAETLGSHEVTVTDAMHRLGLGRSGLQRLVNRHFGFGLKLLMRRTRFLRVLAAMLADDALPDHGVVPYGYWDVPHFLRDSREFLGLTPRRFLAMPMPYLRAALRARTLVLGAPLPLLDPAGPIVDVDRGRPSTTVPKTANAGALVPHVQATPTPA